MRARGCHDDRGQSAVELALVAPILVLALLGGVDLMRVAAIQQTIQNSARVAAEVVSIDPETSDATIRTRVSEALGGNPLLGSPTVADCVGSPAAPQAPAAGAAPCTVLPGGGAARSSGVYRGAYQVGATACYGSLAANLCFVSVRVIYTFKTTINWPFVPNELMIDRTSTFAMERP